ncbi:MAG: hypothetical protein EOP84_31555 [Verrucomicrobiaceae bacterium]|nr:MAG: hypothetical protein EOP84_31555 [Verrucomicrobiaceae bacterium]
MIPRSEAIRKSSAVIVILIVIVIAYLECLQPRDYDYDYDYDYDALFGQVLLPRSRKQWPAGPAR